GSLPVLLTSRVLNEGIDVPDARVGVVLSGSGSVREHVQRLGRVLRKRPGKRALLYEVVTHNTTERGFTERCCENRAYRERPEEGEGTRGGRAPPRPCVGGRDADPASEAPARSGRDAAAALRRRAQRTAAHPGRLADLRP